MKSSSCLVITRRHDTKNSIWNFWFVAGLVLLAIGGYLLINRFILHRRCTEYTQGKIVTGNVLHPGEFARMLTFAVNGTYYRLPFSGGNSFVSGDVVTVFYNPTKIDRHSYYVLEDRFNLKVLGIIAVNSCF